MTKAFILLVFAGAIAGLIAAPVGAADTLTFGADKPGTAAAGWQGIGVVETRDGVRVLHLAGRKDNDIATTPPLPAHSGQKYLLSYKLQLAVAAGELNVQFRCLDATGKVLRPEWLYPTIETHATSLPRPTTISREVSLIGVEDATASVQIVFKWWGTPTGDAWIHSVTWQPLEDVPALSSVRPLDLRPVCNRGFRSGGAVGGWTGQGTNDLSSLQPGTRNLDGVPLVILDPASNGGKSCVVLGSRPGFPRSVTIPVGQRADRVFVLHNSAFSGPPGTPVATWTFEYTDGTHAAVSLLSGKDLADWWSPEDTDSSMVAITTANPDHSPMGLNLCEIANPKPEAEIRSIEIRSTKIGSAGAAMYGLVAATLADGGSLMPSLKLQPQVEYHKATGEWFPAPLPWGAPDRPSPTNVSWLLDKPAGRHGFVHSRNGQFFFDDGSRARFLATTCGWSSWAVPHPDAEKIAAYLSRMGINLLRIYPLGLVTGSDPRTFTLDPVRPESRLIDCLAHPEQRCSRARPDLLSHQQYHGRGSRQTERPQG